MGAASPLEGECDAPALKQFGQEIPSSRLKMTAIALLEDRLIPARSLHLFPVSAPQREKFDHFGTSS